MCRQLRRTYLCETPAGGTPIQNHDTIYTEELCALARHENWDHCANLRPQLYDECNKCYAPSCCWHRINLALYAWGDERSNHGGRYTNRSGTLGKAAMDLMVLHLRCGFPQEEFSLLRREVLEYFGLSDARKVPGAYGGWKW